MLTESKANAAAASPAQPRLVVVGNGMAAMRTVEELLKLSPERYQITVVSKEPHGSYNRILLSPVLAGEKTFDQIVLNRPEWYAEHGINFKSGVSVQAVNRARREVQLDNGEVLGYERLLIATGSNPFIIPFPNHQHPAVISFRDINDVDTMLTNAASCRNVIVIGGGLLGLEAANGLNKRGIKVTVVHDMGYLLNRQLDKEAADLLQGFLEQQGIEFVMNAKTDRIALHDDGSLHGLAFKDGTVLDGQLIVMAVGVRPNVQLAKDMGLQVDKAILVTDTLQTSDPRVYAVGECVQHRGALFGLVAPLFDQAKVCANHLAEMGIGMFVQKPTATTLKVTGVNLYSAGDFSGEGSDSVILRDTQQSTYKRLFFKDDKLVGAVLYGDTQDGMAYFELIQNASPVSAIRDQLMFGVAV
ncbi:MAG: FAD-dependent oxidoreductase [Pseudomonadota bacterium]|nr:FAD-dependent oxidoreductase [Pseudomonadota bacterium]